MWVGILQTMKKDSYNIYCDESCHLLHDESNVFVIGALWASSDVTKQVFIDLREIKQKHGLSPFFEAKWTKISNAKIEYYLDVVKYFFANDALRFRAVVVPDKTILDHSAFVQDHDTWYYKMFYVMLKIIIRSDARYNLYLDIKDTRSNRKVRELQKILNIVSPDDEELSVIRAQHIRSHEVELMQICDIFIGSLAYIHRQLSSNEGKLKVLKEIEEAIGGVSLLASTSKQEEKFNILVWNPKM